MYETGNERCPENFFKSYLARWPTEMKKPARSLEANQLSSPDTGLDICDLPRDFQHNGDNTGTLF